MEEGYKACPYCAEPIREAATICRYCNRSVSVPPSLKAASATTAPLPAKPATTRQKALLAGLVLMATFLWICGQWRLHTPNTSPDEVGRMMATVPMPTGEKKQWYEVRRDVIKSETIDLRGAYGWLVNRSVAANPNVKVFLLAQCAASDPESVRFALMDQENFQRMRAGYPPLALASNSIQEAKEIEIPNNPYWFGFVELASRPTSAGSIPTSVSGALLYLANEIQKQNRPPIRLTAQVTTITRVYGTASWAAQVKEAVLKQKLGQQPDSAPPTPQDQTPNSAQNPIVNQVRAVGSVRVIATALTTYCKTYLRAPTSLDDLWSANLINTDLASGRTSGYEFSLVAGDCGAYSIEATPLAWNTTGTMSLYIDDNGIIHVTRENRRATPADPVLGGQ